MLDLAKLTIEKLEMLAGDIREEVLRRRITRRQLALRLPEDLYTVPEVAKRLQVTGKTVRAWIRDREITAIRIGREWRFREEDIQDFIRRRLSTATQEIHGSGN